MSRLARWGLALVAPRWALAVGDDPRHPGRAGSDLLALLAALLVALHLRALVGAAWLGAAFGLGTGARALAMIASQTYTADLAFLVIAAAVIYLAGGPRRGLGRAFDLACVAAVPLVVVESAATLIVHGAGLAVPPVIGLGVTLVGYTWSGAVVSLALMQMRRRPHAVEGP